MNEGHNSGSLFPHRVAAPPVPLVCRSRCPALRRFPFISCPSCSALFRLQRLRRAERPLALRRRGAQVDSPAAGRRPAAGPQRHRLRPAARPLCARTRTHIGRAAASLCSDRSTGAPREARGCSRSRSRSHALLASRCLFSFFFCTPSVGPSSPALFVFGGEFTPSAQGHEGAGEYHADAFLYNVKANAWTGIKVSTRALARARAPKRAWAGWQSMHGTGGLLRRSSASDSPLYLSVVPALLFLTADCPAERLVSLRARLVQHGSLCPPRLRRRVRRFQRRGATQRCLHLVACTGAGRVREATGNEAPAAAWAALLAPRPRVCRLMLHFHTPASTLFSTRLTAAHRSHRLLRLVPDARRRPALSSFASQCPHRPRACGAGFSQTLSLRFRCLRPTVRVTHCRAGCECVRWSSVLLLRSCCCALHTAVVCARRLTGRQRQQQSAQRRPQRSAATSHGAR